MKRPTRPGRLDEGRSLLERRVREGLPIAESVARRMHHKLGGLLGADELLDIAQPALLDAARTHDPQRAPFGPYLVMKLKWAMLEEARKLKRKQRVAARAAACLALERLADAEESDPPAPEAPTTEAEDQARLTDFLAQRAAAMTVGLVSVRDVDGCSAEDQSPEERLAAMELRRIVQEAIQRLPDRQRALVERHYFGGENFDVIAADLGLSKSWASRLHAKAMESLAGTLRGLLL
jgi:RNA polymerase sigma factor for flagellar operon FliA